MKAGYKVENLKIFKEDNYIIVINYQNANKITNAPFYYEKKPKKNFPSEIGVWKIKQLKNN